MEAVPSSKNVGNYYPTTRRHIRGDSCFHLLFHCAFNIGDHKRIESIGVMDGEDLEGSGCSIILLPFRYWPRGIRKALETFVIVPGLQCDI
jgi:hypothetical protein